MEITYNQAIRLMFALKKVCTEHVAIFRDNGWGDDPDSTGSSYSIIIDGNGQNTFAFVPENVFELLLANGVIDSNTYGGFKDRGYHELNKEVSEKNYWDYFLKAPTNP